MHSQTIGTNPIIFGSPGKLFYGVEKSKFKRKSLSDFSNSELFLGRSDNVNMSCFYN